MVQLNLALREINCKVVYFGCGLGGKTTNLEMVHKEAAPDSRGELTSIATESDRTLFFDFMPLDLGTVNGMKVKFQLYTVPGQVYYNSTRKLVLRGADGVIFIADSQTEKMDENLESFDNLKECLAEQGRSLDEMPHVIQFNKRDLDGVASVAELEKALNAHEAPCFEASAAKGDGVLDTFKALAGIMLEKVKAMSTDSTAKPGVQNQQSARQTGSQALPVQQKPATDAQRLQGGIGTTPSNPIQAQKIDSRPIESMGSTKGGQDEKESAPNESAPRSSASTNSDTGSQAEIIDPKPQNFESNVVPSQSASTAVAVKPASASPAESVRAPVSRRAKATTSSRRESTEAPSEVRARRSITTGSIQITNPAMIISTSGHNRPSSDGKVFWILGTIVAGAGAAAAYFFLM